MEFDYIKYRWFFTKSGKLVVGGKSAAQNDSLIQNAKKMKIDYITLHTTAPGSPFAVIFSEDKISPSDLDEAAVFTASFSREWKAGKKSTSVDIFNLSQMYKSPSMKSGTWGVSPKVKRKNSVPLHLVLTVQNGFLRAVPEKSVKNKKDILLKIAPGRMDKTSIVPKLALELHDSFSEEQILSAVPSGGIRISK